MNPPRTLVISTELVCRQNQFKVSLVRLLRAKPICVVITPIVVAGTGHSGNFAQV